MIIVASDGSSYNNGKKDCVAAYGVVSTDGFSASGHEYNSSSQRGELMGCVEALKHVRRLIVDGQEEEVALLFDSAYVSNALKGRWFNKWARNNWLTSLNDEVKNKDLWLQVVELLKGIDEDKILVYQIKSHTTTKGIKSMEKCRNSFLKNNGLVPPEEVLLELIRLNEMADALAGAEKDLALGDMKI